jgi:Flp pilus assembly protein TadG
MPVLLAITLTVLLGMAGLGVDYGFSTVERRALQNAADAAAVSGAINLSQKAASTAIVEEVTTVANRNAQVSSVICQYVDANNAVIQACDQGATPTTSGIRVVTTNTRNTYFMRVLGIPTATVSAEAVARISDWTRYNPSTSPPTYTNTPYEAGNALFIVCGYDTVLTSGGTMNILQGTKPGSAPWNVNPAAVGREFYIHGSGSGQKPEDCGMKSSSFKGLNGTVGTVTLPAILRDENGVKAGPTRSAVNGQAGCAANISTNDAALNNCVMLLPIAVSSPSKGYLYSVRWLPFRIRRVDANSHAGTLLGNYVVREDGTTVLAPWTYSNTSTITSVRLAR